MHRHIIHAISFVVIVLFFGCKGDPGPAGPLLTGTIHGAVTLRFNALPSPYSDVLISLEGRGLSTSPDEKGRWKIENVPTGIYTIKYQKPGFGFTKQVNVQFVGGGDLYLSRVTLIEGVAFVIDSLKGNVDNADQFTLSGTTGDTATYTATFAAYFGQQPPDVDDPFSVEGQLLITLPVVDGSIRWTSTDITPIFFSVVPPRDTVYLALYALGANAAAYYDPRIERNIYCTGMSETPARTWVLVP